MTTMSVEAGPSRPELELLLAAAVRASQAAVPPAQRATSRLVGWLLSAAVVVGTYDVSLLVR